MCLVLFFCSKIKRQIDSLPLQINPISVLQKSGAWRRVQHTPQSCAVQRAPLLFEYMRINLGRQYGPKRAKGLSWLLTVRKAPGPAQPGLRRPLISSTLFPMRDQLICSVVCLVESLRGVNMICKPDDPVGTEPGLPPNAIARGRIQFNSSLHDSRPRFPE